MCQREAEHYLFLKMCNLSNPCLDKSSHVSFIYTCVAQNHNLQICIKGLYNLYDTDVLYSQTLDLETWNDNIR